MISGPGWLLELLARPDITDICLNGGGTVFLDRGQGLEPGPASPWNEDALKAWLLDQISAAGRTWDARHPFVDATLATGHRLHAAFPPIARGGILVSLRRPPPDPSQKSRWLDSPLYARLAQAARSGESILISGATGSGKTTLANDLLGEIAAHERILALEDTPELRPHHPHFVSLVSRPPNADGFGEVTLRTLLRQALRMRPDRIILGECRGPEVLELLQALNTGHRGALATLHANSGRDALRRIELLCLLAAGGSVPIGAIRELVAAGVQWVAHAKKEGSARRISELWAVAGREGDTILLRPMIEPGACTPRAGHSGYSA